ncbi:MAG: T9SS type A sorting domain-containing protein, partial [Bacteroidota bacterium]
GNLLRGSYRPDSNTVIIRWEFQPNCNFVSGASLNVQTLSYTSCGALANGSGTVGSSLEIPIAGVTNPYSIQFDDLSLSDSFLGCSDAQALSISFQKVGATAVAVEDSIQVFLPAGLGFDAYGGCLSGLCVDDTKRTVRTVGAQTVVSWPLPNLLDGEESSFFIEVIDNGDLFCTESEPINVQTIHQTSVFCPAISANCNSTVTVTGSEEVTPLADKPQLTPFFQNVLSGTFPDNPPAQRHEFRFDVTVTNAGQNTTGDVEVWIFCANSEGTLGSDATPLQIIQIPGPIAAGSASTINVNFFDDACNPSVNGLIALIPDDLSGGGNQCFCPWPAGLDETAANPGILPYEGVSTAEISAVLPIAFLAFSVAQENQYAVLNWTTFEDASANAYTLERSLDGSSFSPIHHQNSRGNIGRATYSFTDQQLLSLRADRIYYRVAHVDINGAFSYSSVIELAVAPVEELSVSAYPNPATEQVVLDIFLPTSSYYRLEVVNKLGQSMYVSSLPNSSPSLRRTIAVAEWPAGLYLIKVGDAREQITYKLLVR